MAGRIIVVDFGMGNLNSVKRKLSRLRCDPVVTSDPKDVETAEKIVLPGVGHFAHAMKNLADRGLIGPLNEAVTARRRPILGICLGMQLMAKRSEEGDAAGLAWLDADVLRFRTSAPLQYKIPHVGWNQISLAKESPLMRGIPDLSEFYFIHSFHLKAHDPADVLNRSEYEHCFTSAVARGNVFGVQYHPEKSHDVGERLLQNFLDL